MTAEVRGKQTGKRLLIAEDDKALGRFLRRGLEAEGYTVRLAMDGRAAVDAFRQDLPDLTILNLNLPIKNGERVLDEVRSVNRELPVMVLSAWQEVDTRVRCLDGGADDFMVKPFSLRELQARCRALLRRRCGRSLALRAGDLEMDRLQRSVWHAGRKIELTKLEFALLEHLMLNRGHCVSRMELLDTVWKTEAARTTNIVDVYVNYVRAKIHDPRPGRLIRTVHRQGYMVPYEMEIATGCVPMPEALLRSEDAIPGLEIN